MGKVSGLKVPQTQRASTAAYILIIRRAEKPSGRIFELLLTFAHRIYNLLTKQRSLMGAINMHSSETTTRSYQANSKLLSRRKLAAIPGSLAAFGLLGNRANAASDSNSPLSPEITVDVRQYGAKADGITDDAPAFNRAIRYIRDNQTKAGDFDVCHRLAIPSGVYAVFGSIDLTQLRDINMVLDGNGSVILGKCTGEPVIDALGSRWLTVRDLTIIGDKMQTPNLGIQVGCLSRYIVADDHLFEDVKIVGHYSLACLLNRAAETTGFHHVLLWNDFPAPQSYCLIQDGLNHFGVQSKFATADRPENGEIDHSFNENEFINCDFRHSGGGVPVWLGDTARHRFIRCYAAGVGEAAFVIYCGQNSHTMLDIDCHCETKGLKSAFIFTGTRTTPVIYGFSYRDHSCFASTSVFRTDSHISKVVLQDANIHIEYFQIPSCKIFDDADKWFVTGRYRSNTDRQWNGDNSFTGAVCTGTSIAFAGDIGLKVAAGSVARRPQKLGLLDTGRLFFDTSLGKLIVWSGSAWVDAAGSKL